MTPEEFKAKYAGVTSGKETVKDVIAREAASAPATKAPRATTGSGAYRQTKERQQAVAPGAPVAPPPPKPAPNGFGQVREAEQQLDDAHPDISASDIRSASRLPTAGPSSPDERYSPADIGPAIASGWRTAADKVRAMLADPEAAKGLERLGAIQPARGGK